MTKEKYIEQAMEDYFKLITEMEKADMMKNPMKLLFSMKLFLEKVYDTGHQAGRISLQNLETQN